MRVRAAIRRKGLPSEFLEPNGAVFMEEDFADNAFVYVSVQLMKMAGGRTVGTLTAGPRCSMPP